MREPTLRIGPYRILSELGRGGMAVVYRAEHFRTAEPVAVKTVGVPREDSLQSLRREIRSLARLRHPGIVRILDEGVWSGTPWYAMELLEGVSLRHAFESRSLSLTDALTLVRRLCAPLAFMHGEGLVHRDLKPDNILITGRRQAVGSSERGIAGPPAADCLLPTAFADAAHPTPYSLLPTPYPVLVDFGLAAQFAGKVSREEIQGGAATSGTVAYMAPEQIQGELVDARTDLYALGCILYELVTGRLPFEGGNVPEIVQGHLHRAPRPPSELVQELPGDLDALILRLLAKRAKDRPGHADAIAAALGLLGAESTPLDATPPSRAYLYRPGFTGREEPLRELAEHLGLLAEGKGGVVLVDGESGVGKTRLIMELAREAGRRKLRVLVGESLSVPANRESPAATDGGQFPHSAGGGPQLFGAPLRTLRPILQAVADYCRAREPEETERVLGPRGKALALYEPALSDLPGQESYPEPAPLPSEAALLRLYSYLAETLGALADKRALVLALDDLQWADELSLGFLKHLLSSDWLRTTPLLVVGTYRSEELGRDPASSLPLLIRSPKVARLSLERLPERVVGSMVSDMLALTPPPEPFVRYLTRQSEGNPFFIAEYLRAAVAESVLYRDRLGRWQMADPDQPETKQPRYEALPLPGTLRDLVGRRLVELDPDARRLAEYCSVLGREISEGLLSGGIRMTADRREAALADLLARQVLEEPRPGRMRFVHDKIREVSYGLIPSAQRRRLHGAAAKSIERLFRKAGLSEHMAVLGHHWEQAGDQPRARECYLGAARHAMNRFAQAEAERLYRAYLALTSEPDSESVTVRNELGESLFLQGRAVAAIDEHGQALREAQALKNRAAEGTAFRWLGAIQDHTGRVEEARSNFEQALTIAQERGDGQGQCILLGSLANLHSNQGEISQAEALYERALALSRQLGDRRLEGFILGNFAGHLLERGGVEESRSMYEQALAASRETGDRRNEGLTLTNLAVVHHALGHLDEAQETNEQALVILREIGHRGFESLTLNNLAGYHHDRGRLDEARSLFEQALAIHHGVDLPRVEGLALISLARLERHSGHYAEPQSLLERAEHLLLPIDHKLRLAQTLCERGFLAVALGEPPGRFLDQARALAAALKAGTESILAKELGRLQRAAEALEAGRPLLRGECPEDLPEGLRLWLERHAGNPGS